MRTNHKLFLHRPKQASQRRCPNQQQPRASIDGSSCYRRAAPKNTSSARHTSPPQQTNSSLKHQQQASLGHSDCIPSTRPRRRSTAHTNGTANKTSQPPDPLLANHKSSSSVRRNLPELDSSHLLLECVLLPELDGCHLEFNLCMYTNVHVCGYGLGTTHREHINQRRRRV